LTATSWCSFTADEPQQLGVEGALCVKLTVHGESFVFNQIRRMVGAAAAAVRGVVPLDMIRASLATPCGCTYAPLLLRSVFPPITARI